MEMFLSNPNTFLSDVMRIRKERLGATPEGSGELLKEGILSFLLRNDFISFEEKGNYEKPLQTLPETRKDLIVAYLCKGIYDPSRLTSIHANDAQRSMLDDFGIRMYGGTGNGKVFGWDYSEEVRRLEDTIGEEDRKAFELYINDINFEDMIKTAQTFVDGRRERLKRTLLNALKCGFAYSLLMDGEELEYDPIYYLRWELKKSGFRLKAKTLNDSDKKALESVAEKYLDLIEYLYLSGRGDEIERKQDEIPDDEMIVYEDISDEVMAHFSPYSIAYSMFVELLFNQDSSAKAFELLRKGLNSYFAKEDRIETIKKSKFSYLIEEDSVC